MTKSPFFGSGVAGLFDEMRFSLSWRDYQARVLAELGEHLGDNHLHIIAAPGSGKTVLGLEVVRRLDRPALILAPTVAIRDQWVDRLEQMFLAGKRCEWVSKSVLKPRLLTVSTYQALFSAYTAGQELHAEEEEGEEENHRSSANKPKIRKGAGKALARKLRRAKIQTIVVDEAHHLRTQWWRCLMAVKRGLDEPVVVALTATPPYDVGAYEWEKYHNLCGPVDAEISVPELVRKGNLCPHQDCVYISAPTEAEMKGIRKFRRDVAAVCRYLLNHDEFAAAVRGHWSVRKPGSDVERILEDSLFYLAVAVFLKRVGKRPPRRLLRILGVRRRQIPRFTVDRLEHLLTGCLFTHKADFVQHTALFASIKQDLKRIHALRAGSVELRSTSQQGAILRSSVSKLDSIEEIVKLESESLGRDLRMVVLTDYIRAEDFPKSAGDRPELTRIGVAPVFEKLRRVGIAAVRLGILSGSIVMIERNATEALEAAAAEMGITPDRIKTRACRFDSRFINVELIGRDRQKLVGLITKLFNRGSITVMVATKSLLGEGWDAPSINSLVLASCVGSYMLSNQMRGRAIRTQRGNANKTANIWHPVCIEPLVARPGKDMESLERRFRSFVGISYRENIIESLINRLQLPEAFNSRSIADSNETMRRRALNRQQLRRMWASALGTDSDKGLREELRVPEQALARHLAWASAAQAAAWASFSVGMLLYLYGFIRAGGTSGGIKWLWWSLFAIAGISAAFAVPHLLKSAYLFFRHGFMRSSMRQIGRAVLQSLSEIGLIKTDMSQLKVRARRHRDGRICCTLQGGTTYEKSVFLDAAEEAVRPVKDPRYLLIRKSPLGPLVQKSYHAVPTILARRKEHAEVFARKWRRHVGSTDLVYTRSVGGRLILLKARSAALGADWDKSVERVRIWK